jgi:hypothetical protein
MPSDEPRRAPVATTNAAPLHREVRLGDGETVTLADASGVAFAEATSVPARPIGATERPGGAWIIALIGGAIGGLVLSMSSRKPPGRRGI